MKDDLPIFTSAKRWLDHYFNGDDPMIDFQLLPEVIFNKRFGMN